MIVQTLNVIPHGIIESGQVILKIDQASGLIDSSESIVAGLGIFSQTEAGQQDLKIAPALLLSANVKPGTKLQIQNVSIVVGNGSVADIAYQNGEDYANGTANLDLSGEYVEITHVNLNGVISGYTVQLELVAA